MRTSAFYSAATSCPQSEQIKQTVYIIGDGPEAHLTAIKLKQKGMKNVVMIGMRFQAFTRSASFNLEVFDRISASIAPLEIKPSDSFHIKDVERELHPHAKELGVQLIDGKFDGFENRQLRIIDQQKLFFIPIQRNDLVVDCSGVARAALKSINEKHKKAPVFQFTAIDENSHKTYASIRMYFTPDLFKLSTQEEPINFNPVSYALAIEELRALGWNSYAVPYCHRYRQLSKFELLDKSLEKFVLYFQMPELRLDEKNQKDAQRIAILVAKILLKLFRNNPDDCSEPSIVLHKKSNKYPHKQAISVFTVDPYQTTPSYYEGDEEVPLTFHAGDSTLSMPFVMGRGLICGIERTEALIEALTICDGFIKDIDYLQYDLSSSTHLLKHSSEVKSFFEFEKGRIQQCNEQARHLYTAGYHACKNPINKKIIKVGLERLNQEFLANFHQRVHAYLGGITDQQTGFKFNIFTKDELIQKLEYFVNKIIGSYDFLYLEKNNLKDIVYEISNYCKKAGTHFFLFRQYLNAIQFYEKAIWLHERYLQPQFSPELLDLYANVIIAYSKRSNFDKVIYYACLVDNITPFVDLTQIHKKIILEKINYNKATALIQKCKKYSYRKNHKEIIYDDLLRQIDLAIARISSFRIASQLIQEVQMLKRNQTILEKARREPGR